jgi:glycerophosphoryl diester phosphodiesterase
VVAHRGASAVAPENTLDAFDEAISAGADAVEFDVRLSLDGVVFLMHDADVSRTTDGVGSIERMTAEQISELTIVSGRSGSTRVPSLEETLAHLSGRIAVDVELKNIPGEPDFDPAAEPLVEATLAALEGFDGEALISSFNPFSLMRVLEVSSGSAVGLLSTDDVDPEASAAFASDKGFGWILPGRGALGVRAAELISRAHSIDVRVGTWVVDDPIQARALIAAGVDAIATNDPSAIVAARDRP